LKHMTNCPSSSFTFINDPPCSTDNHYILTKTLHCSAAHSLIFPNSIEHHTVLFQDHQTAASRFITVHQHDPCSSYSSGNVWPGGPGRSPLQ
jgi:hypothetical protein